MCYTNICCTFFSLSENLLNCLQTTLSGYCGGDAGIYIRELARLLVWIRLGNIGSTGSSQCYIFQPLIGDSGQCNIYDIIKSSHECQGTSNHHQLEYLFNRMYNLNETSLVSFVSLTRGQTCGFVYWRRYVALGPNLFSHCTNLF